MSLSSSQLQESAPGVSLVREGAVFEKIATGFQFVEGPAWHPHDQVLVFSDIIGNTQYRWTEQAGVTVFRHPSHMANGACWDHQDRLLVCEHATSRVARLCSDGRSEVLASNYQGFELNSPNDIVVKRDGMVYFTDPNSGRGKKYGVERNQQLDFQGVFRLDPESLSLELLADDFSKPNGLCFSLDESKLYINDTDHQHVREFNVHADGSLSGGDAWASVDGSAAGVADGMKVDSEGNLYCCGSGGIHVFNPAGARKGVIATPEVATNFTWGGIEMKDLYITATHSVYCLRMNVPGWCHQPYNQN